MSLVLMERLSHIHLLDLQVVGNHLEAARLTERHLTEMVAPQLFAQDILATGFLQDAPVFVTGHAPVHHPHDPAQLPVVQVLLHLRHPMFVLVAVHTLTDLFNSDFRAMPYATKLCPLISW